MRILQIITRADAIGGAHTHVRSLSSELLKRGHEVTVAVGPPQGGSFAELLDEHRIRRLTVPDLVRSVRPHSDLRALRQLRAAIRELQPDIIHCHSSKAGVLGRIAARAEKKPCVFTAHGWAFAEGVPATFANLVLYWIAQLAGAFVGSKEQDMFVISSSGIVIRVPAGEIRRVGRSSQGVRTMRVEEGAHVVALAPVIMQMEE
jgi:glycosyltransferase involved in cell wall biosynthesis